MPFDVNIISYKLVILIFYMGVYDCSVMEVLFLWSVEYRAPQCQTKRIHQFIMLHFYVFFNLSTALQMRTN